jgi:hypothetical protein
VHACFRVFRAKARAVCIDLIFSVNVRAATLLLPSSTFPHSKAGAYVAESTKAIFEGLADAALTKPAATATPTAQENPVPGDGNDKEHKRDRSRSGNLQVIVCVEREFIVTPSRKVVKAISAIRYIVLR